MNSVTKFALTFLAITGATTLLMNYTDLQFRASNFWDTHNFIFLVFITIFPRLTLILSSIASGGLLWWLALLFAPRILVAGLATISYWESNPVLVIFSWLIAISGETGEKSVLKTQVRVVRTGRNTPFSTDRFTEDSDESIEVEYKEL